MSLNYFLIAEYFSKGIEIGLIDWREAVRWADSVIESNDNPDAIFIDVSLCLSHSETISALHAFPKNDEIEVIAYALFAKLHDVNLDDIDSLAWAIKKAMQVSRHCEISDSIYYDFDGLEDYLFLARHGEYGSIEECRLEFIKLIDKLAKPLILD